MCAFVYIDIHLSSNDFVFFYFSVKMFASPIRTDLIARTRLPREFFVRLGLARYLHNEEKEKEEKRNGDDDEVNPNQNNQHELDTTKTKTYLVPSGISPNMKKYPSKSWYLLCWRAAVVEWISEYLDYFGVFYFLYIEFI